MYTVVQYVIGAVPMCVCWNVHMYILHSHWQNVCTAYPVCLQSPACLLHVHVYMPCIHMHVFIINIV